MLSVRDQSTAALVSALRLLPGIERQIDAAVHKRGGVLIAGGPGTGREALARTIHEASSRADGSFVVIDCAADLTRELSRLLDDTDGRPGGTPRPNAGTLFLRNPFDLPRLLQGRLAGFLREGTASGAGRRRAPDQCNVRPIAAVDAGFDRRAHDETIQPGLYRRFSAVRIDLPALREQAGRIPRLAQAIVTRTCEETGQPPKRLARATSTLLAALAWRGNLVELQEVLEAAVGHAGPVVELQDVIKHVTFDGARGMPVAAGSLRDARARFEREYIAAVLTRNDYQMAPTAAELGVERANLYRKIRQLRVPRRRTG